MFKTVKRIIDWCGEFKGKLYLGFVMTFFSHIFAAMPLALAAYTVGLLIESRKAGTPFDTSWIWKCIVIQIVLVLLRFLFDYFRARLQEPISYQLTARDRLAIGDALKRVSLGYFQQVSTGNILSSITTGLSTLENMGIRMIDNFVGGYLNFLVIFVCLAVCSPVTALIALAAALLSLLCMLLISHYSRINSPVEAQANRDMTGAVIEYARGLAVVKSFGKSGASMDAVTSAILKNAPIIILDEATASIDPENEHLIQQAIAELTRGKTIITIAHRLATIQNADQILVVEDGRIAQRGTHAELVQQDGLYQRFTAIRQQSEGWRIAAE